MSNKPKSLRRAPVLKAQNGPIYSKPTWKSTDTFVINGSQLEQMATLAGAFRPLVDFVDTVIRSGELADTIKTDFVYSDGTSVPKADERINAMRAEHDLEMGRMRKQIEEYQVKMEEAQAKAQADSQPEIEVENSTAVS